VTPVNPHAAKHWRGQITARQTSANYATIGERRVFNPLGQLISEPAVPFASSFYAVGYEADKAFDGSISTKWVSGNFSTSHLGLAYNVPQYVGAVEIAFPSNYSAVN